MTSLIQDLSLSDQRGSPSAPPSKRQCRSLSFSDEMSGCRTSWRPLGSRVWTPVEKRRCYSGGSVPRLAGGPGTMQRSSSFSLPSRGEAPAGCPRRPGGPDPSPAGPPPPRPDMQRSLSCSHERLPSAGLCAPSAGSSPASTPELARRPGGLARSRSQPCVLNDRKVGVKRRRPEDGPEQRPSLDLAKMAQVGPGGAQAGHGRGRAREGEGARSGGGWGRVGRGRGRAREGEGRRGKVRAGAGRGRRCSGAGPRRVF